MLHNIVIKQRKVYLYNNRFVQGGINADEINLTVDPEWEIITTSSIWHPGDENTESLFYEIVIAPDGIIVWEQPLGEYNAPDKGDLRHYPDADSPIYRSLIDDNAYSPEVYPDGWELYEA